MGGGGGQGLRDQHTGMNVGGGGRGWRGTNNNIRIQREREGKGIEGHGEGGRKKLAAGAKTFCGACGGLLV